MLEYCINEAHHATHNLKKSRMINCNEGVKNNIYHVFIYILNLPMDKSYELPDQHKIFLDIDNIEI